MDPDILYWRDRLEGNMYRYGSVYVEENKLLAQMWKNRKKKKNGENFDSARYVMGLSWKLCCSWLKVAGMHKR